MSDAGDGFDLGQAGDAPANSDTPRRLQSVSLVSLVNDQLMHRCAVDAARRAARAAGVTLQVISVDCDSRGWNAARGLNTGLEAAEHRWALCIHQDVLLPPSWFDLAERSMAELYRRGGASGGEPAVWGTVGVQVSGRFVGAVRDPAGFCRWGRPPARVISLDEHLLLVDREAGLRFDPRVPGFHCYGTDLAIRARLAGRDAAVLDAPVVHLSSGRLDAAFDAASAWMLERWGAMFEHVIPTPATTLQRETPTNAMRRRMVATHRRVARRMRSLTSAGAGPWSMPRAVRDELAASVSGLPPRLAARVSPGGARAA